MMHEAWIERLSGYIDGELDNAERRALEAHLVECDECSATLAEIREVVAAAHDAPLPPPPAHVWQGIAAQIGGTRGAGSSAVADARGVDASVVDATLVDATVVDAAAFRRRRTARVSFSVPQLAAAALVLMSLSGGAVYLLQHRADAPQLASGTILQTAGGSSASTLVESAPAADPAIVRDVVALEDLLEENRADLDPATVQVIEQSLASIDQAIADARTALESDPGNPYLSRHLDNTMRKKADILRHATRTRGGT